MKPLVILLCLALVACSDSHKRYNIIYTAPDGNQQYFASREEPRLKDGVYSFKANGGEFHYPAGSITYVTVYGN